MTRIPCPSEMVPEDFERTHNRTQSGDASQAGSAARGVQMTKTQTIDGEIVVFRRRVGGWVGQLRGRYVHFIRQPGRKWRVRLQHGQEPVAVTETLADGVRAVRALVSRRFEERMARRMKQFKA